jgi:hypothetical protein
MKFRSTHLLVLSLLTAVAFSGCADKSPSGISGPSALSPAGPSSGVSGAAMSAPGYEQAY